jgi:excisionase family DNA binding protein
MDKGTNLTAVQAARLLRVSLNWVYILIATGKLAGTRVDGRWQVESASVQARLAELAAAAKK